MTRREFLAGAVAVPVLAGVPPVREMVWLEAVVGPSLPNRIAVPVSAVGKRGPLFELRTYTDARVAATVWGRLSACGGLSTRLPDSRSLLTPFESFTHRDQTWRKFHADRVWESLSARLDTSYQFSIYIRKSSPL